MKNILFLLFVLSIFSTCKQTQLTSKFNKKSKKIYVKPLTKTQFNKGIYNQNKTLIYSEKKLIEPILKKSINLKTINNTEELFANADFSKQISIVKENETRQKLIRVDSILKSKDSTLIEKEEILKLSNQAKKFSILSLLSSSSIISLQLIDDLIINEVIRKNRKLRWKIGDFINVLSWILGIACFVLSVTGLHFLVKALKKIKKSGDKLKHQNKTVKKNLKVAYLISFLHLIAPIIIGICLLIWVACCFSIPF